MEDFMNAVLKVVAGLSVLALMMSCGSSSFEKKGDSAYNLAQKLQGDQKRTHLKTAYMMYDKAIKSNPNKISPKLRNRYIEMTLIRASMVLNEGAAHMEAIPLFLADIKKFMTPEVSSDLKQQHALLLSQMADSSLVKDKFDEALSTIDEAIAAASDPSPLKSKKQEITKRIAQDNYDMADMEYQNGKQSKDAEDYVKAEFYALSALYFDSTHQDAKKLLATLRKENRGTYSAYLKVIDPIPDSSVFKKINKWDILLAMPTMEKRGGNIAAVVDIYNNSWNPLRLKANHFQLVDVNGKTYPGKASRIDPEILDQEHEAKLKLTFPAPKADIQKLIYKNGDHYSEKLFR
jgi:hypothetical protein